MGSEQRFFTTTFFAPRGKQEYKALFATSPRLMQSASRQQQTQHTLLDWLRVEYGVEKPGNKLLALTDLDSNTWVGEVKCTRGQNQPLSSAGRHTLRDEYTRAIEPARALAAETLTLERTLSDLVNQAYALTPAEIALMWQTAPPRLPSVLPQQDQILPQPLLNANGLPLPSKNRLLTGSQRVVG